MWGEEGPCSSAASEQHSVLQLLQLKLKLLLQQLHIKLEMASVMITRVFVSSKS